MPLLGSLIPTPLLKANAAEKANFGLGWKQPLLKPAHFREAEAEVHRVATDIRAPLFEQFSSQNSLENSCEKFARKVPRFDLGPTKCMDFS